MCLICLFLVRLCLLISLNIYVWRSVSVSAGSSSRSYIRNLEVMTNRQTNRFSTCRLDPLRRNFEIDPSWKHLSFDFFLMPSASAALFEFRWGRQSSCLTEYSISEDLVLLGLSRINWKIDELHCFTLYRFALEEVWWQRKVDGCELLSHCWKQMRSSSPPLIYLSTSHGH